MELLLAYPAWYLILCTIGAALGSWLLYRKDKQLSDLSIWLLNSLRALRFLSLFLLLFLLLEPMLSYLKIELRKPVLILLQDNSRSLRMSADSVDMASQMTEFQTGLEEALDDKFNLVKYQFGEEFISDINYSYTDDNTNLNEALDKLYLQYGSSQTGLILLMSDGLINEGRDPYYADHKLDLPVYNLGLGDTSSKADLQIAELRANKIAYLGNEFPLEYSINKENLDVSKLKLEVYENGQLLRTEDIAFTEESNSIRSVLKLEAKEVGIKRYQLRLQELEGEWTYVNNRAEFSIEVIDSRAKVLLVSATFHPDIAAFKESLNRSDDFEAFSKSKKDFEALSDKEILNNFNLLLFHGMPGSKEDAGRIKQLVEGRLPVMIIVSSSTDIQALNSLGLGVQLKNSKKGQMNEVTPAVNNDFSLFQFEYPISWTSNIPPLRSPFGQYEMSNEVELLFAQQLGQLNTGFPLLVYSSTMSEKKYGILMAEGIWRWRLFDYRKNGNQKKFDELVGSTVRYLASKEDRSRFRIDYKKEYDQSDEIEISAELYNPSFQLTLDANVEFELENESEKSFSYQMSPKEDHFELDLSTLPAGSYRFKASTALGADKFNKEGEFVIKEQLREFSENKADHAWLRRFSGKTGGEYFHQDDKERLVERLTELDIKAKSDSRRSFELLIEFPWLLVLLVSSLAAEWFVRRRQGSY